MKKRILSVLLSLFIICGVVLADYERVQAVDLPTAFWGTLEASRAWFTAMQAGGAFDRGISFNQFVNTTSSQWQEVERKTMEAFKLYLFYRYQIDVTEKFPNMTVEEVRQEALRLSTITYNSFMEKAINVSNTTKEGITVQDFKYWKDFCKEFRSIAQNGLGSGGDQIGDNTIVNTLVTDFDGNVNPDLHGKSNIGKNTIVYDNNYFVNKGTVMHFIEGQGYVFNEYEFKDVPTDRVRIGFTEFSLYNWNVIDYYFSFIDVNRLTGAIITKDSPYHSHYSYSGDYYETVQNLINNIDFPNCVADTRYHRPSNSISDSNYVDRFKVTTQAAPTLDWQYEVNDSLENTAGQAIKDGNTKQSTKTIVREGSVPIKRSSLKEEERNGEKVVSGVIGWDIPGTKTITAPIVDDTKEDEFIEDIGIIDVPEDIVIDDPVPGEIVIPVEEDVVIPVTPDVPIPIIKLLEIQYGPFYPTAMESLEEFFPFCIPFDIYYCIQKFNVEPGEAPILHLAIPIPRQLQSTIGVTYDVNVDLNDYVLLRDIIRYFILLTFIVGLMTLTRDIIRG